MLILRSTQLFQWGDLSLPVWGLQRDWCGNSLESPLMFSLAEDAQRLWFLAAGRTPTKMHPLARPGAFLAELWRYDCAELFLADPVSGRYFEFNLAANGAWWSAEFTAPRQRAESADIAFPDVATFAEMSPDGGWMTAMAIPLDLLRARLAWSDHSRINVTFIANSPAQQFLTATRLPGKDPDFHQPEHFSPFRYHPLEDALAR
ncbi:MAG: hypothetical protein RI957_1671 [Verrucomicrobiota bacterium]|jgi:hypothetical protein